MFWFGLWWLLCIGELVCVGVVGWVLVYLGELDVYVLFCQLVWYFVGWYWLGDVEVLYFVVGYVVYGGVDLCGFYVFYYYVEIQFVCQFGYCVYDGVIVLVGVYGVYE